VALTEITGNPSGTVRAPWPSGVLLGCVAAVLAVEMKSLLIGESASAEVERAIVAAPGIRAREVQRVIHLRTLHMARSLLVAAKIAISGADSAALVAAGIGRGERRVRSAVPIAEMIYLEPDIYRPGKADATDPAIRAVRPPTRPGRSARRTHRPHSPQRSRPVGRDHDVGVARATPTS